MKMEASYQKGGIWLWNAGTLALKRRVAVRVGVRDADVTRMCRGPFPLPWHSPRAGWGWGRKEGKGGGRCHYLPRAASPREDVITALAAVTDAGGGGGMTATRGTARPRLCLPSAHYVWRTHASRPRPGLRAVAQGPPDFGEFAGARDIGLRSLGHRVWF